jgi:circadian clock protein KaiC
MHLATIHKAVREFKPKLVIVDPITNFFTIASQNEVKAMLMRLVDFLKMEGITAVFTSLTAGGAAQEATEAGVSSLIDTWLLMRDIESNGERNRAMYVLKSRGTAHSNQIREFILSSKGINLVEPYLGEEGVLTGSARVAQEAKERSAAARRSEDNERKRRDIERRRQTIAAQIDALRAELDSEASELSRLLADEDARVSQAEARQAAMAASRKETVIPQASPGARRLRVKREVMP